MTTEETLTEQTRALVTRKLEELQDDKEFTRTLQASSEIEDFQNAGFLKKKSYSLMSVDKAHKIQTRFRSV